MATQAKDRMRKMRAKRQGRTLSIWLNEDAARIFKKLKTLTNDTNDAIVNMAIQDVYNTVFSNRCYAIIDEIRAKQEAAGEAPGWKVEIELTQLYKTIVEVMRLDYGTAEALKKALNAFSVPTPGGKTGAWKINQVRKFM
jgi:hypothetical protein